MYVCVCEAVNECSVLWSVCVYQVVHLFVDKLVFVW